jgi:hypothetical protein
MFLLSIAITAGCLSKESVSSTPITESLQATPAAGAGIGATNSAAANTGSATPPQNSGQETSYVPFNTYNTKDIPVSKMSEKIVFTEFYIRDLTEKDGYYYGFMGGSV